MAQLKIQRCKVCTSPLPVGIAKCPKCGAEHQFVPEVVNPLLFSASQAENLRTAFETDPKSNPRDVNSLFGKGLIYLSLQNYELASLNFKMAVDLTPNDPDVYYYYALSLFAHRSPVLLSDLEAERIEMWLQTAIKILPKRKYLILELLLLQGAFKGKGKAIPADKKEPEQLLLQAKQTVQEEDELYEIEQHVLITDERNLEFVSQLRGKDGESHSSDDILKQSMCCYANVCSYPKGHDDEVITDDGVAKLMNPSERKKFFLGISKPEEPCLEKKDTFVEPCWVCLKSFAVGFAVWFVSVIILSFTGWLDGAKVDRFTPGDTVEKYKESHIVVGYFYDASDGRVNVWHEPTEEEIASLPAEVKQWEVNGIASGWRFLATIALFFFGPLIWISRTFLSFRETILSRRYTERRNVRTMADYQERLTCFLQRPTVAEYMKFCQLFAGPNAGLVNQGDFVSNALRQAHISERDVTKGKVYFFNGFFDARLSSPGEPQTILRKMRINVAIAMPDRVLYMHGVWDTLEDEIPMLRRDDLLYSLIAMFKKEDGQISIVSNTGVNLAPIVTDSSGLPCLFQYQSYDSQNVLTYSRTRTTNCADFYTSLIDMHGRYNKQGA